MPFSMFDIHPDLARAIKEIGFKKPTPVQEKAIPKCLKGKDVLASAQTGSGKTVAFALPMLHHLLQGERGRGVRALVLVPVRELGQQVESSVRDCARFTKLRSTLVIGGANMRRQAQALRDGADVVIATPGRLLDHLQNTRGFDLKECRTVILDEADRMLDMGFLPDVSRIMYKLPRRRQTMMFSATLPPEIERLIHQFMKEPVRVQIDPPRRPAVGVVQNVYPVSSHQKYELLAALIRKMEMKSVLVFTNMKRRADLVASFLGIEKISARAMHSDLNQNKRSRTMDAFRDRKNRVLVATDIAARGLDIRHVSHVVNFDVPLYPEDYLHRIGRTARVFTVGDAITFMSPSEKGPVASIEKFIDQKIPRAALEGFPYDSPPELEAFKKPEQAFSFRRRKFGRKRRSLM